MFFIEKTIRQLTGEFDLISKERKIDLERIASFIENSIDQKKKAELIFICTHNSRRSHIAQVWSSTAADYYGVNVRSWSGGTEATAFNPRAVDALRGLGFKIEQKTTGANPVYSVRWSDRYSSLDVYSKKYNDPSNPASDFVAVMTCTHADENCPVVVGANARFSLPFDDPKDFDGTELESIKYRERSLEIGREILYLFSKISRQ
ncbi:MAG: hypothetical protein WDO14_15440 [Bacteroidota bacterium]